MFNNCQDAMAICRKFGYPDLFITATCNSGWPEIQRFVRDKNLKAEDRPDICVRVFKMKLDILICDLRKGKIFGGVDAGKQSNFLFHSGLFSSFHLFHFVFDMVF